MKLYKRLMLALGAQLLGQSLQDTEWRRFGQTLEFGGVIGEGITRFQTVDLRIGILNVLFGVYRPGKDGTPVLVEGPGIAGQNGGLCTETCCIVFCCPNCARCQETSEMMKFRNLQPDFQKAGMNVQFGRPWCGEFGLVVSYKGRTGVNILPSSFVPTPQRLAQKENWRAITTENGRANWEALQKQSGVGLPLIMLRA